MADGTQAGLGLVWSKFDSTDRNGERTEEATRDKLESRKSDKDKERDGGCLGDMI